MKHDSTIEYDTEGLEIPPLVTNRALSPGQTFFKTSFKYALIALGIFVDIAIFLGIILMSSDYFIDGVVNITKYWEALPNLVPFQR